MSMRALIRVITPSSFKAIKAPRSVTTLTQRLFQTLNRNVAVSSSVSNVQDHRLFSQQATIQNEAPAVDYEYVKQATRKDSTLIIDVREPDEVKEHGKIPNSINIPLGTVPSVLSTLSEDEFKQTYERAKPKQDTEMIFYCMIGKRSGRAQQDALSLGFRNAKNYVGSWTDWATRNN